MLTLEYAKDPVYSNAEGTDILLTVKWEEFPEEMPFAANTWDPEFYGRDLYYRANAGEFGPVGPYVPPPTIDFEPTPTTGTQNL
jgi:hypothetical protein